MTHYRYYTMMIGLRGCYMPDTTYQIQVKTRRELHNAVKGEASVRSDDGSTAGLSKRNVAWLAAHAWRSNNAILPFGRKGEHKAYSIEVHRSTRKDWLRDQENA